MYLHYMRARVCMYRYMRVVVCMYVYSCMGLAYIHVYSEVQVRVHMHDACMYMYVYMCMGLAIVISSIDYYTFE